MDPNKMKLESRNLFIDTQYFVTKMFNFESKEIQSLIELSGQDLIRIYLTDITKREVQKKIKDKVKTASSKLNSSDVSILKNIKQFHDFVIAHDEKQIELHFLEKFDQFIEDGLVMIISSDELKFMDVFENYCENKPPFNSTTDKNRKNEFPDAFALKTIENWSEEINEPVYLLSGDSDWKLYSSQVPASKNHVTSKLLWINDLSELLDAVIRHEDSLKNITAFSDNLIVQNQDSIEDFAKAKFQYCGFNIYSDEFDAGIIDVHILSVSLTESDIISVNRESAVYSLTFDISAVFGIEITETGPYDEEWRRPIYTNYHTIYQHHIFTESVSIEFSFEDSLPQNFKITSADIPLDIEISYDDGDYFELEDWARTLPVAIYGVSDGKINQDGSGMQEFVNFEHAQKTFPELNIDNPSGPFLEASGNKISEPLVFLTVFADLQ